VQRRRVEPQLLKVHFFLLSHLACTLCSHCLEYAGCLLKGTWPGDLAEAPPGMLQLYVPWGLAWAGCIFRWSQWMLCLLCFQQRKAIEQASLSVLHKLWASCLFGFPCPLALHMSFMVKLLLSCSTNRHGVITPCLSKENNYAGYVLMSPGCGDIQHPWEHLSWDCLWAL